MKILQVGVGRFGKNHLRIWHELGVDLYVADLSEKALENCKIYKMSFDRVSKNYKDFLDKVDAVDVVTPADNHHVLVKEAINAGKHVFVEKPITYSSKEGEELARLAKQKGVVLHVGHLYRYNPAAMFIENAVKSGVLGDIRYIYGKFTEFKRARNDVGVVLTDGIHYIDLANICFGKYPKAIYSEVKDHFCRGMEDFGILLLDYGTGIAKIETGNIHPGRGRDFVIIGSKGTIIADMEGQKVEILKGRHENVNGVWTPVEEGSEKPFLLNKEPLKEELKDFLDCINNGKQPTMNGVAGTNIVKIVETAYESAKQGKKLEFQPFEIE